MKSKGKIILGIDPGSTIIGFGILRFFDNDTKPSVVEYGYIDLSEHKSKETKLLNLSKDLNSIIKKHKPSSIAVESLFFFKNAKTFTAVCESKGVIILCAALNNTSVYEYTPLQVKQTISGYGKSSKQVIEKLIQTSLNIDSRIKPDDTSDALAIALCHFFHSKLYNHKTNKK